MLKWYVVYLPESSCVSSLLLIWLENRKQGNGQTQVSSLCPRFKASTHDWSEVC